MILVFSCTAASFRNLLPVFFTLSSTPVVSFSLPLKGQILMDSVFHSIITYIVHDHPSPSLRGIVLVWPGESTFLKPCHRRTLWITILACTGTHDVREAKRWWCRCAVQNTDHYIDQTHQGGGKEAKRGAGQRSGRQRHAGAMPPLLNLNVLVLPACSGTASAWTRPHFFFFSFFQPNQPAFTATATTYHVEWKFGSFSSAAGFSLILVMIYRYAISSQPRDSSHPCLDLMAKFSTSHKLTA